MSIYSTSVSALRAAQVGIATTGHNIANANTVGYRRQEAIPTTSVALNTGSGFIGQGVDVSTVRRIYDVALERQVTQTESDAAYQQQFLQSIEQIDNILGDRSAGFSAVIQNFFKAWNELANDPSSTAARQSVLGAANTVSDSINGMGDYLQTLQNGVNNDIIAVVDQVNSYSESIASLNESIKNIQSSGLQPPNDLLDQRDTVVSKLNELVGISVIKDSSTGDYNVFMAGNQLVTGSIARPLVAQRSEYDPSRIDVFEFNGLQSLSSNDQIGGELGALLDFRSEVLDVAQNSYGRIAIAMANGVNALHTSGRDLAGALGGDFFTDPNGLPQVYASNENTSAAVVDATISDAAELTTSDYLLTFNGGNYTLTRTSDGQSWSDATLAGLTTTAAQGFTLTTTVSPNAGDSFLIRPTAAAASSVEVAISDPDLIAAADGTAAPGDILNNANALAIAQLQSDRTLIAGNNTLESSYAGLVSVIGNRTAQAQIQQQVQSNLLDQARLAQQSASGVNLDEEAANLIRYQQAYQAAAQVIRTATTLFDTLLGIGG